MRNCLIITALVFSVFFVRAQTTQFRGPNRDGIFPETGLLNAWPETGPELIMSVKGIGLGWSSAVVHDQTVYVTGKIDSNDVLSAISPDGTRLWQTIYGRSWNQTFPDTRSTPTIENNRAYLVSGMGEVVCIDLSTGAIVWKNNAFEENDGTAGTWGIAESVLLYDNKAFFATGGSKTLMLALDKHTGEKIWETKSLNDNIAYVSPILIEWKGKKQIVGVSASYIYGVNPENGTIDWTFDYIHLDPSEWDNAGGVINCTSPIFHDGFLYVTSGYNHIGIKLKLNDDLSGVELLWKEETLDNHHGGVVLLDGLLYGSNWINNGKGNWCCIDFQTGETRWETSFRNKGSIVSADGMLYIYTEQPGYVGLVQPGHEQFELVSNFAVKEGTGPHWAHPTIANGKLYIRHGDVLMVYDIQKE